MTLRLRTFLTGCLALLLAALLAIAPVGAKPASGGYQLFGGAASDHQADISLAALGNFDYFAKIAPECCIAPNTGPTRSPWTQVSSDARAVALDIESATGRALPQNQRTQLAGQLRVVDHRNPVSDADYANLQREYRRNRTQMIRDWETNTGQNWPEGAQLHHVIPQRYGGPNQWWNAHPALPSQHQGGIHGTGSPTQTVFPTPVPRQ